MNAITGSINNTKLFLQLRASNDTDRSKAADRKRESQTSREQQPITQNTVSVRYQAIPPSLLARLHFRSELENNPELDIRV
jgi:hypothetical protein